MTLAERLAAESAQPDQERAEQRTHHEAANAAVRIPSQRRGGRGDLRSWVKAHRASRIAEFAGLHLFAARIVRAPGPADPPGPQEEQPVVVGVSAAVETVGSVSARAALTGAPAPGLRGWQKMRDDREAWLIVNGPEFRWVVPVPLSQVGRARVFAAEITTAGRRAAPRP